MPRSRSGFAPSINAIEGCLARYEPERVAIEQAFYAKNVHTTLLLGHARGVLMLAAQKAGAVIAEYSPREIKKAITGNGNAEKSQVEYMVKMLLSLPGRCSAAMPSTPLRLLCATFTTAARARSSQGRGGRPCGRKGRRMIEFIRGTLAEKDICNSLG